jgi:hypothetical protein
MRPNVRVLHRQILGTNHSFSFILGNAHVVIEKDIFVDSSVAVKMGLLNASTARRNNHPEDQTEHQKEGDHEKEGDRATSLFDLQVDRSQAVRIHLHRFKALQAFVAANS